MLYLSLAPEILTATAQDLASVGSAVSAANLSAASLTEELVAAAGDEVSAAISRLFGTYAQDYQALSAQAALFHDQFVQALTSGAGAYASTEFANASPLQTLQRGAQS